VSADQRPFLQPFGWQEGNGGSDFGNTIHASRFLPYYPYDVTVAVHWALARLFSRLHPHVVALRDVDRAAYRKVVGGRDGRTCWTEAHPDGAPPPLPLLWADDRIRLPASGAGVRRVGVCWRGSNGDARSVPPEALRPLLAEQAVEWVGLQLADHAGELPILGLATLGVRDWADTAGVVGQLDLVITVDTAVAHLAASMGARTWVLSPAYNPLRWAGLTTGPMPWYPTVRVFQQGAPGEWRDVVDEVRAALPTATVMRTSS